MAKRVEYGFGKTFQQMRGRCLRTLAKKAKCLGKYERSKLCNEILVPSLQEGGYGKLQREFYGGKRHPRPSTHPKQRAMTARSARRLSHRR